MYQRIDHGSFTLKYIPLACVLRISKIRKSINKKNKIVGTVY